MTADELYELIKVYFTFRFQTIVCLLFASLEQIRQLLFDVSCHMSLFIIFGKIVTKLYKDNKNTEQKQEKRDLFNIFNIVEQCTKDWRRIS